MTTILTKRSGRAARIVAAAALAGLVVLAPATPAAAHNQLIETDPAPQDQLTTSPDAVELVFVEPLDPDYTTVIVNDADQSPVPLGEQVIDGGRVTVSLPSPLPDGAYTVAYRVVSNDGHPVQGSYEFTVAGAGAADADAEADDETPAPEPGEPAAVAAGDDGAGSEDSGGGSVGVVVAAVGAVGLLAAGAYLGWRRHRRPA